MKTLELNQMEIVEGGVSDCTIAQAGFVIATIGLYASPFTGGVSLGLLAFGGFVISAYGAGKTCDQ